MRRKLVLLRNHELLHSTAARPEKVGAPEAQPESHMPGSDRRDWVYREMALLGPDAESWTERKP